MQISAANLLATQSQTTVRPQGAAAAFEPITFKQTPAVTQTPASKPQSTAASATVPTTTGATGYVRPGTNLDIKI